MNIGVLVYEGVQALDLAGPLDVFGAANRNHAGPAPYRTLTIGLSDAPVRGENGPTLAPDTEIAGAPALDTLIIPGGEGSRRFDADPRLLEWIRERARDTRRVASVCTGLYLLAATGVLDGRRATTHWRFAEDLKARYPRVRVDAKHLHLADGQFYSSGGLTAGMDLALALVQADLGPETAIAVARELVMYMKRPGNQLQFSAPLQAQSRANERMGPLVDWLLQHLHQSISVDRMAEVATVSPRNFRRVFRERFGTRRRAIWKHCGWSGPAYC